MSSDTVCIAIEGMPGSGKTSCLISLVKNLNENVVLLPETNLKKNSNLLNSTNFYTSEWIDRMRIVSSSKAMNYSFILDRSYFSNLAYIYAADSVNYNIYKTTLISLLKNTRLLDKIIVFDISPAFGLNRKINANDFIPYPWNNISFLNKFRSFYFDEMPKLVPCDIIYLNGLNKIKLIDYIPNQFYQCKSNSYDLNYREKNLMQKFAKNHSLGEEKSKCIIIKDYKIIYYRTHAIFIDKNNEVKFFDNHAIAKLFEV
jgi:thymidylate kinase